MVVELAHSDRYIHANAINDAVVVGHAAAAVATLPMALRVIPMVSDLMLQKLLYFSLWSGLWFGAAEVGLTIFKLTQLDVAGDGFTRIGLPVLVAVWCLLEMFRIRLGYIGNLGEKVPETSAFWLLTLLPQLPIACFLSFAQPKGLRMDLGSGLPHIVICLGQLYCGFRAVRTFIRKQTADFYRLCQEEALAAAHAGRRKAVRPSGDGLVLSPRSGEALSVPFAPAVTPVQASRGGSSAGGAGQAGPSSGAALPLGFQSPVQVGGAGLGAARPAGGPGASAWDSAAAGAAAAAARGQAMPEPRVTALGVAVDGVRHLTGAGSRTAAGQGSASSTPPSVAAGGRVEAGVRERPSGAGRSRSRGPVSEGSRDGKSE